jgi:hypothetical protein
MKAYSVNKAKGVIVPSSRISITTKEGLVASTDQTLVFVDSPNDIDRTNLSKMSLSLIPTTKDSLFLVVSAEADFAW